MKLIIASFMIISLVSLSKAFIGSSRTKTTTLLRFSRPILKQTNLRMQSSYEFPKDEGGWRTKLDPNQFAVLRQKATEPPGFSENTPGQLEHTLKEKQGTKYPKEGVYTCVGCDAPLYTAQSKFDSGCGWPAFYEGVDGAIKELPDADGRRIEIVCNNCGSHLGHVFKGEGQHFNLSGTA